MATERSSLRTAYQEHSWWTFQTYRLPLDLPYSSSYVASLSLSVILMRTKVFFLCHHLAAIDWTAPTPTLEASQDIIFGWLGP